MFDIRMYKQNALTQLKNRWNIPCLLAIIIGLISLIASCAGIIVSTAISGILEVAFIFVLMALYTAPEKITFDVFLQGLERTWLNALLGSLWFLLWVFLWTLLFIIPGIIKAYSYSMMFFVIAENPTIGATKAMDISKVMTDGHKADLFMLDLSFIGWLFLCLLSCGIGFFWLIPYLYETRTNAYFDLKRMAFQRGLLTPADFNKEA